MKKIRIYNLSLKYYLPLFAMLLLAVMTGRLNHDAIGTIVFLLLTGGMLSFLGERIPVIGKWMAGSILLPMLGGSLMVYFHVIPAFLVEGTDSLMSSGIVNILLSAMIVGAILRIDRDVLKKVSVIILPGILIAMFFSAVFLLAGSWLTGLGIFEGVFAVGLPNFCGGSPACLAAIPEIFSEIFRGEPLEYAGQFMVMLVIANFISVLSASILNSVGKKMPGLTGNGTLIPLPEKKRAETACNHMEYLEVGCVVSLSMLVAGHLVASWLPFINYVGWATILVIILKIMNVDDEIMRIGTQSWETIVNRLLNPVFTLGIGICYVNLENIKAIVSAEKLVIVLLGIAGALIGSFVAAKIFHLYPIDTMIAIGCNYATLGGSGTIAVLSASDRMSLMPFATITIRIGGAIALILYNVTIHFFV